MAGNRSDGDLLSTENPLMTVDLKALPNYPALQQLARALWHNGSVRGAAVLVGAGF